MFKTLKFTQRLLNKNSTRSKIYVTGIQPTGIPHIGNYLGFIQQLVEIQKEKNVERFLFIADLHSISTGFIAPKQMHQNIINTTAALLACGIDPNKTVFFQQSQITEHTELSWILGGLQTITSLQRLPQYKNKSQTFKKGAVPVSLLTYPLLQAADVLLYKGSHIPVGEDQNQHINIVRHMAQTFNANFKCDYFPVPEKVFSLAPRVKSLKNPIKKMSKSDASDWSRINLSDSNEIIFNKCKRATSDSEPKIYYDPERRLAISNLILLHALFSNKTIDEIVNMFHGLNTLDFKKSLYNSIETKIEPIRSKFIKLIKQEDFVNDVLLNGNKIAQKIAKKNLQDVKEIVGFNKLK